jgi:hypothetical protein
LAFAVRRKIVASILTRLRERARDRWSGRAALRRLRAADVRRAFEIGDRACDAGDAVERSRAHRTARQRGLQQLARPRRARTSSGRRPLRFARCS